MKTPPMMINFVVPDDDPAYLAAVGRLCVTHEHLMYCLRMCIKSLTNAAILKALEDTKWAFHTTLRKKILHKARERLGKGEALARLEEILDRSGDLTEKRNDVVHALIACDINDPQRRIRQGRDLHWGPLPSASYVLALSRTISHLAGELNHERRSGELAVALTRTRLPKAGHT
jgi:hypothetical protein